MTPRVAELFDEGAELAPGERAPWLDRVCGGDDALRAELLRLLQADDRAGAFLERPPSVIGATLEPPAGHEPLPQFGSWRALCHIGAGGMGDVWLAERSDGQFDQRAAVKQLAWPTPGLLQRFRQERQILARLQHPDIARLIDGGVDAGGAPYLVMEYVDGVPITRFARDRALALRARIELFLRVCTAVQYAHQNLVVHRDLKPSNILVGADGALKLLDFGIAKVLATTDAPEPTQTAARLLTPDYAAPEQFSGGPITTATDVYALGVLLYELLSGSRPPQRGPGHAADGELAPPSAVPDRHTAPAGAPRRAIRGDLDRITLKALAAQPHRRYASVEALIADLQRYLDGRPISVLRDSPWYRARKFVRRNRYALAAAAVVFAVCVAATGISLRQARVARDQAQRAAAVREFIAGVFAKANPDENRGQPITAQQLLEKGEAQLDASAGSQPAVEADLGALLAQLYRDIGDNPRGAKLLERALAQSASAAVPDDVRARVLLAVAAAEVEDKARFDSAYAHATRSLDLLESASDLNYDDIAEAQRILALVLIGRTEYARAAALLERNIPIQREHLVADSEALADEYVLYGVALGDLARFDESAAAFDEGARRLRRQFGPSSNHLAYALNEMGSMLYTRGDLGGAEQAHRQVLEIHRDTLGPDHHNTIIAESNLLGDIEEQGRFVQALPQRLALYERAKDSALLTPIEKAYQQDAVGIDLSELGRFAEAESWSRGALARVAASQGPRSPRTTGMMRHLGLTLALLGRYAEAEALFRDALAIKLEHGPATSLGACGLRRDIGQTLRQAHRYPQAIEQLQALTRDACMVGLPDSDPWQPVALSDLSQAQLDAGDAEAAYATAQRGLAFGRKALHANYKLAVPLFAMARAELGRGRAAAAEPLLREALALRNAVHPASDPRVLELKAALAEALLRSRRRDEADPLIAELEPHLAGPSPYVADLRARIAAAAAASR